MRVLFLTCHLPWPPVSGGRHREWELIRRLRGIEIDLVAVSKTPSEDQRDAGRLAPYCRTVTVVPAEGGLDPCRPSQVNRHDSPRARRHVAEVIRGGSVDLVHVEGFYLYDLLPRPCPVPTLLVEQNVEHQLWHQRSLLVPDDATRRHLSREAALTRAAEEQVWAEADGCVALTAEDARIMAQVLGRPVDAVVPDGLTAPSVDVTPSTAGGARAVFVANFAYQPNLDAAWHLLDEIVPRVRAEVPQVAWSLVGNAPSRSLRSAASTLDVAVTGRVPSVAPYLAEAHVVTCPLRVGGGVKVKVLEALAHGRATVTSSVGAQGLSAVSDALVVADDPAGFAAATVRLLSDPDERRRVEDAALRSLCRLPSWDEAAAALTAAYGSVAGRRATDSMAVPA